MVNRWSLYLKGLSEVYHAQPMLNAKKSKIRSRIQHLRLALHSFLPGPLYVLVKKMEPKVVRPRVVRKACLQKGKGSREGGMAALADEIESTATTRTS